MTLTYRDATALVTGASSGLGAEFARRLAARGTHLVLAARREDRLRALAGDLTTAYGVQAAVEPVDLSRPGAGRALADRLAGRGVDVLVNNAGFGLHGPLVDQPADRVAELVQLNVAALVDLTRGLLPGMVSRGAGAVVNVASTAAYQPTPYLAAYGASKAFVLAFTEAVAAEVRGAGVRVLAVSPGPTETEFFETASRAAAVGAFQTAAQVVDVTLRTLDERRTPSVVSGGFSKAQTAAARLLPRRLAVAVSGRLLAGPR